MKIDLNEKAAAGISEYCKSRNYKCSGCRYSIKEVAQDVGYATCIFEDCPCDWDSLEERYQNAIRHIGGAPALLALPDEVKSILQDTDDFETKVRMFELIAANK